MDLFIKNVGFIHICILLFLYSKKNIITIKKVTVLTIVVLITPLVLHFIAFSMPYLLDNSPFILLEFNHQIYRILVFSLKTMGQVLVKIFTKKGIIDLMTNICILYVIKVVLLGSLSIFNTVSNLLVSNSVFSLTQDFYSITLIKVVRPYVEKIFTSIIIPCFDLFFPSILCDSPKKIAKLFSELPFSNVDRDDMVRECRTNTHNKSREDLKAEFEAFRLKISLYTPSFIVSKQSSFHSNEVNFEEGESSKGQLDKGKKRALDNTQEEAYKKRTRVA